MGGTKNFNVLGLCHRYRTDAYLFLSDTFTVIVSDRVKFDLIIWSLFGLIKTLKRILGKE